MQLLNRVFSTHLIGFMLRTTKQERKSALKRSRYCASQDAQGGVCFKWAEIYCRRWRPSSTLGWYSWVREVGTERLIHRLGKQMQFCMSFIAPWLRNGSFQRGQSFQSLNRSLFASLPVAMNLRWRLKEYCQKNRQQRGVICEEFSVWHFATNSTGMKSVKPGMSSHFSESRDPSYVSWAICPECPAKDWRRKSLWLQSTPTGKWPKGHPRTRWRDYIFDLAWSRLGVELAELSEITVDREIFRVLPGLLPPATLPKDKAGTKMSKWMSMQAYIETLYLWNCL